VKLGRLLIAAVILAGLAGALWWSNKTEAAKANKPATDNATKILALPESDMRQIEIKKRDGESTVLKKDDGGRWTIAAPKQMAADQAAASGLATAVANLTAERVVDDHATDLPSYGLSPAADEITFTTKDGKNLKLLIGDDTPTGSAVYAMAGGDSRLFTMGSSNKNSLDKTYKDLRDRRLMTFEQDKISRVELTAKKQTLEFGRVNQSEWQILKPRPLRADGFQVEELVRKVKDANMDANTTDEDAKKYAAAFASATPDAIVKVTDAGGTQTLDVRKSKDDYYAKSSIVEGVHKVTKDLGEGVDKALDDFRSKKVFDFGFNDPNKVEIKDGGKTVSVEKTGDKWTSGGKPMDSTSVQALIDKLRDLSAAKLVESGFTSPAIELTVVSNDGKRTEKVQISPEGDKFLARREGDTSLYEMDATPVKDLRQAAADVKPAAAATTDTKKK
jgi:hypothetical protein